MNENLRGKIDKILSFLTPEQLDKDILELEDITGNRKLIIFLEEIGAAEVKYKAKSDVIPGKIQEKGGNSYLWYKKSDGTWIIKLWEINRLGK